VGPASAGMASSVSRLRRARPLLTPRPGSCCCWAARWARKALCRRMRRRGCMSPEGRGAPCPSSSSLSDSVRSTGPSAGRLVPRCCCCCCWRCGAGLLVVPPCCCWPSGASSSELDPQLMMEVAPPPPPAAPAAPVPAPAPAAPLPRQAARRGASGVSRSNQVSGSATPEGRQQPSGRTAAGVVVVQGGGGVSGQGIRLEGGWTWDAEA
jgi:hypothetical protein